MVTTDCDTQLYDALVKNYSNLKTMQLVCFVVIIVNPEAYTSFNHDE